MRLDGFQFQFFYQTLQLNPLNLIYRTQIDIMPDIINRSPNNNQRRIKNQVKYKPRIYRNLGGRII